MHRKIIHIDMDAFYASIEQRDNPEYRGKPLLWAGCPRERAGWYVTVDKLGIGSALDIATAIRAAIKSELALTASAGISINKFLAKTASDMNKPDGLLGISMSNSITGSWSCFELFFLSPVS